MEFVDIGLIIAIVCLLFVIFKLRNKAVEYKTLVDNTTDVIYLLQIKPIHRIVYISLSVESFCGYTQADFYADPDLFIKITHPEDYPLLEFVREHSLTGAKPVVMRWIKKDGSVIWIEQRLNYQVNKKREIVRVEGVIKNITYQKKEEFTQREASRVFKELFDNATDCIILYEYADNGLSGYILNFNNMALKLLEYSPDEILACTFANFLDKKNLKEMAAVMRDIPGSGQLRCETELISKNGNKVPVEINFNITYYRQKKVILSIARDVTVRKQMELEILKHQKLDSIGILAGGLAHDFNNYLTAILGNVNLAINYTIENPRVEQILLETEKAIIKATGLTQQLLTFAKGGAPVKKYASLADIIKETTIFTLRGINIESRFDIPENLWPIEVDAGQIGQVFNNLVINARQAMPGGGVLDIKIENILLKDNEVPLLNAGKYIKIIVKDTGVGIPPEYCGKIFDPFFTTKEEGSGLGLTLSYNIIRKHLGYMTVKSEMDKGTTFFIYLPALEKARVFRNEQEPDGIIKGKDRILVMDDQVMIMNTLGRMLNFLGYTVTLTTSGEQAIKAYKEAMDHDEPFDLVLMDLTIQGGMGGEEAIKRLIEMDENVCAVVSSGYSNHPIMANYMEYGFKNVICKPYTIKSLGEIVSETISEYRKKKLMVN